MDSKPAQWDSSLMPELLPIYYKKLFPFTLYYKWLSYKDSGESYFRNREFSFTLKDDIYLRYRSYSDQAEMEKDIKTKCPHKIDIGAVYSSSPKMRDMVRAGGFVPQYKELVFDIDMTDYDDVRVCCSGADICPKCWPLMTMAIKIIQRALTQDFGFRHLLWVYSGRRGVHCWVCDDKARKLSSTARSAIAEYLSVVKGGANMKKKVQFRDTRWIHPSIKKSIAVIAEHFESYINGQELLGNDEQYNTVKALITDSELQKTLQTAEEVVDKSSRLSPHGKHWRALQEAAKFYKQDSNAKIESIALTDYPLNFLEMMLQYCYPRLDVNVSTGVNHLLKSPFCIHPKTGRVCVPIDCNKVDQFSPFEVPTLQDLTEELANWKGEGNLLSYKKTSLRPYIEIFEKFITSLHADDKPSSCKPQQTTRHTSQIIMDTK